MEKNKAAILPGVRRSRDEMLSSLLLFPILLRIVRDMERWLEGRSTRATYRVNPSRDPSPEIHDPWCRLKLSDRFSLVTAETRGPGRPWSP